AALFEDFGSHVSRRAACRCKDMELLFVHDPRQTKVCDQQVCIIFWGAEQEVFWLQVAMHDTMVVQISHCGEDRADEVCSVGLVVAAFTADAVEQLSSESEIGDQVHCELRNHQTISS